MSLTTRERKTLLAYKKHGKKPPTSSQLWRPVIPRFVLLALLALAAYYFSSSTVGIFFAGSFVGALLRELSFIRSARQVGPILYSVIDWDLVDKLLQIPPEGSAQQA